MAARQAENNSVLWISFNIVCRSWMSFARFLSLARDDQHRRACSQVTVVEVDEHNYVNLNVFYLFKWHALASKRVSERFNTQQKLTAMKLWRWILRLAECTLLYCVVNYYPKGICFLAVVASQTPFHDDGSVQQSFFVPFVFGDCLSKSHQCHLVWSFRKVIGYNLPVLLI